LTIDNLLVAKKTQGFRRRERLQKRTDFAHVYGRRRSAGDDVLTVYLSPNGLAWSRLGISVGKRVGPAVRRTYVRRRIREAFRRNKDRLPAGMDIICVAKPQAGDKSMDVVASLIALTERALKRSR
jgi:ribonuclease P protein component